MSTITFGTALKRGRDVRKMEKPYTGREVVYTCSNGWTVEKVIPEEFAMEGFFMGHCLSSSYDHGYNVYSLREPDGTPHVTVYDGVMTGRCNLAPKEKYASLCREFDSSFVPVEPTEHAKNWSVRNAPDVQPEGA